MGRNIALISIATVGLVILTCEEAYSQENGPSVEEQFQLAKEGKLNGTTQNLSTLSDEARAARPGYEIQNYCITEQFGVGDGSQPTATILIKNEFICQPVVTWYMTYVNSSMESKDDQQIVIKVYKDLP